MAQFSFSSGKNGPFWGFYRDFRSRDSHELQNDLNQRANKWAISEFVSRQLSLSQPLWAGLGRPYATGPVAYASNLKLSNIDHY